MTGIEPPSHWSATERAVWDALAAGRAANLNAISGGTGPEVDDDAGWASATGRTLSTRFIRDLLSAPYVEALPDEIIFLGARFQSAFLVDGGIDATLSFVACHLPGLFLIGGAVAGMLHLARTRVASDIWIERVDFTGGIEILGGRIDGALKLADVDIAEQVVIRPSRTAHLSATPDSGEIPLTLAGGFSATRVMFQHSVHISGTATDECLDIVASTVTGDLSLDHNSAASLGFSQSRIGGNLFVHNNQVVGGIDFEHGVVSGGVSWINTGGAKAALSAEDLSVGRSLRISDSKLTLLDIDRAAIAHDVTISNVSGGSAQEAPYFAARRARVGGSLSLKDCRFGLASLAGARVEGDFRLDGSTFAVSLDATALNTGGTLFLGDAELAWLDLTGATIGRDLSLLSWLGKEPRWTSDARLSLRNATADAVCDSEGAWPGALDLEGFAFKRIASHGSAHKPLPARDSTDLIAWLARDPDASAQPYVQLARVLREAGQIVKANDILYAARERERVDAWRSGHRWKAASLWVLRATMGYGLGTARFFRAFWWVLGFVLAGVAVLHLDQHIHAHALAAKSKTLAWMLFASLDAMLPIVSLDSSFAAAVPAKLVSIWFKAFFWVQGLVGWALGAFLAAGLAGLTQRPN